MKHDVSETKITNIITLLIAIPTGLVLINILLLSVLASSVKTVTLLKSQLQIVKSQQVLLASQSQIYDQYKNDIDSLSRVFPSEDTIAEYISVLEDKLRTNADSFSFKFSSLTPVPQEDKLYLPATINMQTDIGKLYVFLKELEHMPYMTHIDSIQSKTEGGYLGKQAIIISIKVYVQNPFATK